VDFPALVPLGERAAALRRRLRGSLLLSTLTWDTTLRIKVIGGLVESQFAYKETIRFGSSPVANLDF